MENYGARVIAGVTQVGEVFEVRVPLPLIHGTRTVDVIVQGIGGQLAVGLIDRPVVQAPAVPVTESFTPPPAKVKPKQPPRRVKARAPKGDSK